MRQISNSVVRAEHYMPLVLGERYFHKKLSNCKLDKMRTHQTDESLFLELQIRTI